jgi:twitching motility protein PilT
MASDYAKELNGLAEYVLKEGASDLHLSEGKPPVIRINGELFPLEKQPSISRADAEGFAKAILKPKDAERFMAEKEVDVSWEYADKARFRVNGYFQRGGISFAMRLIPRKIQTLEELHLPPILESFTKRQQGFFLVVGPIGSGKSTTLAALIDLVNATRAEHIMTIEDPIEYVYEQKQSIIDQREVRIDTKDFRTALTSLFREDIDVALIGEMRDLETIASAVTAAETGHLIFSTLHTNNAAQTIDRIIDIFPSGQQEQIRLQLAGSLTGIFSQRLVPRVAGGRVPAYELLISNNAVANLIREKRTHEIQTVIQTGGEQGMIDMDKSLAELVRRGEITPETAFSYSINPAVLERLL